jgi:hypothetical protein
MRRRGHERTGRGHERNDWWPDGNGSDLRLVRTKNEKKRRGGEDGKGDLSPLHSRYSSRDGVPPRKGQVAYLPA